MLPIPHRIAFLLFACVCVAFGVRGFAGVVRRIRAGRADTDARTNGRARRIFYALVTTLTQSRTFRKRPVVSFLHSWIFYGFTFYLLVNFVDAVEGFYPLPLERLGITGRIYLLTADVLSAMVLLAVLALVVRRFALPSRRDFRFNERTRLHEDVRIGYITRDSLIVSAFILFHVGSRAAEMGAKIAVNGADAAQPFATLLSHMIFPQHAEAVRVFGYWGALGSVLAFLAYFPYSKHIHLFAAPVKYAVERETSSGVLPAVDMTVDPEVQTLGASTMSDLAWPRLLDAYACIQCNRCQDVCPATATGKSLSPSALEINKRMELNSVETTSPRPLLTFALTPEAAWACTTCGACMQACPVQDEPMLDLIDIRRQQVMMEGVFPAQLQTAFRGMERAKNPWGIAQENRLAWAQGLNVKTFDENPGAEVLYWVGCAASYDPQAQKTARALVQLLDRAGVNFAVLGKKECCTGDSARRAGNEPLYLSLAEENVRTLNEAAPKLILATCPHCMNALGKEYAQLGGNYAVMHHTEYLELLVQQGRLSAPAKANRSVSFHDPCYLGRHNGVYDAPRNLLHILSNDVRELGRNKENSFCCGAGGAQFWKEEEAGTEKISTNRLREAEATLATGAESVLAVGCPFCKSMLQSSSATDSPVAVMDVAELLWESVAPPAPVVPAPVAPPVPEVEPSLIVVKTSVVDEPEPKPVVAAPVIGTTSRRPKWPRQQQAVAAMAARETAAVVTPVTAERKKWVAKSRAEAAVVPETPAAIAPAIAETPPTEAAPTLRSETGRKKWPAQQKTAPVGAPMPVAQTVVAAQPAAPVQQQTPVAPEAPTVSGTTSKRPKWPRQQR